jgi:uncharacterized protein
VLAILTSLLAGIVFGIGLTVSGMINPAKVIGFLDFAGNWDPTLALVMGGALLVTIPGYAIARRRQKPAIETTFHLPSKQAVDGRLIGGAALFGIGWGLAGFCPGPALAALATGLPDVVLFVAAMAAGMLLFRLLPQP